MQVKVSAPNRVDLAGGTLDIWPLYAFMGGGYTINAAISVRSEVTISTRRDQVLDLYSKDMATGEMFDSWEDLQPGGPMDLVVQALLVFRPSTGLDIRTRNTAPKGSGLGASSSLLIALLTALDSIHGRSRHREDLIDAAANIEARCIGVPTGKQDYYAAAYGGINAIRFGMDGNRVDPLVVDPTVRYELGERLALVFTGEAHFSGTTNWGMTKAYIDDTDHARQKLGRIRESAEAMRACLLAGDLDRFGEALEYEWDARKYISEGVTTDTIEAQMAAAKSAGAIASKVCGAGGGGCMISFCKPGRRPEVEKALAQAGAEVIPYSIRYEGAIEEPA